MKPVTEQGVANIKHFLSEVLAHLVRISGSSWRYKTPAADDDWIFMITDGKYHVTTYYSPGTYRNGNSRKTPARFVIKRPEIDVKHESLIQIVDRNPADVSQSLLAGVRKLNVKIQRAKQAMEQESEERQKLRNTIADAMKLPRAIKDRFQSRGTDLAEKVVVTLQTKKDVADISITNLNAEQLTKVLKYLNMYEYKGLEQHD